MALFLIRVDDGSSDMTSNGVVSVTRGMSEDWGISSSVERVLVFSEVLPARKSSNSRLSTVVGLMRDITLGD